jgi:predicted transcriptional regulator
MMQKHVCDKGMPYEFQDAQQLMIDFFNEVDRVLKETNPQSITSLAETTGRKPGNLSRTLKTVSNYGIVEMKRERNHVRPVAKATEFRIVA